MSESEGSEQQALGPQKERRIEIAEDARERKRHGARVMRLAGFQALAPKGEPET